MSGVQNVVGKISFLFYFISRWHLFD